MSYHIEEILSNKFFLSNSISTKNLLERKYVLALKFSYGSMLLENAVEQGDFNSVKYLISKKITVSYMRDLYVIAYKNHFMKIFDYLMEFDTNDSSDYKPLRLKSRLDILQKEVNFFVSFWRKRIYI